MKSSVAYLSLLASLRTIEYMYCRDEFPVVSLESLDVQLNRFVGGWMRRRAANRLLGPYPLPLHWLWSLGYYGAAVRQLVELNMGHGGAAEVYLVSFQASVAEVKRSPTRLLLLAVSKE